MLIYLGEKTGKFWPKGDLAAQAPVLEWLMWQVGGFGPMPHQFEPLPDGEERDRQPLWHGALFEGNPSSLRRARQTARRSGLRWGRCLKSSPGGKAFYRGQPNWPHRSWELLNYLRYDTGGVVLAMSPEHESPNLGAPVFPVPGLRFAPRLVTEAGAVCGHPTAGKSPANLDPDYREDQ